jgi:endonuclease/exonuclease/phosphatase family metal-dependent hydrolase
MSVMTLNACADVCGRWSSRQKAALKMVRVRHPDVLATQESYAWHTAPPGYALAAYKSAKRVFYKKARFTVAKTSTGARRAGGITLSAKWFAAWAELIDRKTGKHIIFVSVHTTPGSDYAKRGREMNNLFNRMKQINTAGRTVVFAGDFNSHKHRGTYNESTGFGSQDSVGKRMAQSGYYDAYDLADTLKRPNWDSYSGFRRKPIIGLTWGDHVDHVYVKPGSAHVWRWMNAALYSGAYYATPIPSDHSPVQVDLYLP